MPTLLDEGLAAITRGMLDKTADGFLIRGNRGKDGALWFGVLS